jgi:U3 small nucleolar RNA-associated protein 7
MSAPPNSTGLTKNFLGKEKKMRNVLQRAELRTKAQGRFLGYLDKVTSQDTGYLEADDNETTRQFRQKTLMDHIPLQNQQQIMNLDLEFGSYNLDFSRDGQELLLGSSQGHVAVLDWKTKNLKCEFNVKEKIRDVKFLHSNSF